MSKVKFESNFFKLENEFESNELKTSLPQTTRV